MNVAASPRSILDHLDKLEPSENGKYHCPVCNGNDLSINQKTGAFTCYNGGCDGTLVLDAIAPRTREQKSAFRREKNRPKSQKEIKKEGDAIASAQAWEVEQKATELAHSFDPPLVSQAKLENEISAWAKQHKHDPFTAKSLLKEQIQKLNPTEKEGAKQSSIVPALTTEEWDEDLENVRNREKTEAERYESLFVDHPLSYWIGEDAAKHYNTDFDPSNNIFVAAAWTHLTYLGSLMPANIRTYKLANKYRGREDISINLIAFISADRNGGKSTARGIVSKSFGEMVLSQIQSEWVKESIRAKKDAQKAAKQEGGDEREPSAYDSGLPRVEFGDPTIAALSKSMGVNAHYQKEYGAPSFGGIVTLDEGADFLNCNGMLEIKNKNPGFSFINGVWSGTIAGRSRISTSESGNAINHVNLNFLLPLQSDKYEALISHPSFASSGLNSRVICVPLRKIANSQSDLPSLTKEQTIAKTNKPKTCSHYPNQEIIRAIGNVRRQLKDQDFLIRWSDDAIGVWLDCEGSFIGKTVDSDSEETTMRQRAYEDNVAKCAAMQAVSDAVYDPKTGNAAQADPFNGTGEASDSGSIGVIQIEPHHVMRALDLCELSLKAQLYFWEKTAPDRERAIAASTFTAQKVDWVGIFNDPAQLRDWVKGKREGGAREAKDVYKNHLRGDTRKLLKQAGINASEAIKAVWEV